jgi:putative phosphoribosyl transferase
VLALPRGGVAVAFEIARALEATPDLVLVRNTGVPWQSELALGAVADGPRPEIFIDQELARGSIFQTAGSRKRLPASSPRSNAAASTAAVRRRGRRRLVLAVPVAPPEILASLVGEVDETASLETPEHLAAIGFYYRDFYQMTDAEVMTCSPAHRLPAKVGRTR